MEHQDSHQLLTRFNGLYKELDEIYHSLARHFGLSDCAFWILYTIKETKESCTQSEMSQLLSLSKQTVNSALKSLEAAGYIRLESEAGHQKKKQVLLTDAGNSLAQRTVEKVTQMELRAFEQFSAEEQVMLFRLLTAYVKQVGKEAQSEISKQRMEALYEHHND